MKFIKSTTILESRTANGSPILCTKTHRRQEIIAEILARTIVNSLVPSTPITARRAWNTPPKPSPANKPAYSHWTNIEINGKKKRTTHSESKHVHVIRSRVSLVPEPIYCRTENPTCKEVRFLRDAETAARMAYIAIG